MINRREALKVGAAGLATSMLGAHASGAADDKTYRVGLIGCGWYGKSDLFRLIQVSPVEVVALYGSLNEWLELRRRLRGQARI